MNSPARHQRLSYNLGHHRGCYCFISEAMAGMAQMRAPALKQLEVNKAGTQLVPRGLPLTYCYREESKDSSLADDEGDTCSPLGLEGVIWPQ